MTMDQAAWLGVALGMFAAGVQHFHVVRSIKKRLSNPAETSLKKTLFGSMVRFGFLVALFSAAGFSDRVRLDTGAVTFAVAHLAAMLYLGVKSAAGTLE